MTLDNQRLHQPNGARTDPVNPIQRLFYMAWTLAEVGGIKNEAIAHSQHFGGLWRRLAEIISATLAGLAAPRENNPPTLVFEAIATFQQMTGGGWRAKVKLAYKPPVWESIYSHT